MRTTPLTIMAGGVAVLLVVMTFWSSFQSDQRSEAESSQELQDRLQQNVRQLQDRGIIEAAKGDRCIVGETWAGLDDTQKWGALVQVYNSLWETWPTNGPQPVLTVLDRNGEVLGQYTPREGFQAK